MACRTPEDMSDEELLSDPNYQYMMEKVREHSIVPDDPEPPQFLNVVYTPEEEADMGNMVEVYHDGVEHETTDAVLFIIDGKKQWIPKRCMDMDEDYEDGMVFVKESFAIDEGLV